MEVRIQAQESGIPKNRPFGIGNLESSIWDSAVSTSWNPESKTVTKADERQELELIWFGNSFNWYLGIAGHSRNMNIKGC